MKTIALVIGISDYKDTVAFQSIPGAQADASRFATALSSWGLPPDWIIHLSQEKATKAQIIKAFYDFRFEFDVEAKFIFYFAGHGVREHDANNSHLESSLILHDTNAQDILGTGLRLVELMQLIRALRPLQTFLFIDACRLRLNNLVNPLNDTDVFSTTNSKGFFCIFSSGILPSYEDAHHKSGYFTNALLQSIEELRLTKQPSCHDILKKVENSLLKQNLPPPEAYHVGSAHIWPLEAHYALEKSHPTQNNPSMIDRWEPVAILQEIVIKQPQSFIWMWGEAGLGKTVIAEQLAQKVENAIYTSVLPSPNHTLIFQALIEQIRSKKSELFFNRPPERTLSLSLSHIVEEQPNCLLIIDHIDRLEAKALQKVITQLSQARLSYLLISRHPYPKLLFDELTLAVYEWQAPTFSYDETRELIEKSGLENSLSNVLVSMTHGNALKTRQMLVKLSGNATPLEGKMNQESIRCIKAIIACGGFLDEHLFCQSYRLKQSALSNLVQFGLIRYSKEGCFPHDLLEELVEENQWSLDFKKACHYWGQQVTHTPYNRLACRSLVVLVAEIDDCTPFKSALGQCLTTLNEREYCNFLLDLVALFKKHNWEDLLLQASDYLVDHEEYQRSGEVLEHLVQSGNSSTKYHAIKNAIRRLVWIGQYREAIRLYDEVSTKCQASELLVAMRNHIGIAYFFLGHLDTALSLFQSNIDLKKIEDERELGITKYMLGLIMTYRNEDMIKAKKLIETSILIFESTKFYHWIIVGLNGLADLAYSQNELVQALVHLQKSLAIAKALQNKTFLLFTLKNMARVKLRLFGPMSQELLKTAETMQELLEEVLEVGHNWATMWAQNVLCTVYAHQKEPQKMAKFVTEVASLTQHYDECHIFSLSNLGHYAALTEDYSLAKQYYSQAYTLCKRIHNPFAKLEIRQDFLHCQLPSYLQENICQ